MRGVRSPRGHRQPPPRRTTPASSPARLPRCRPGRRSPDPPSRSRITPSKSAVRATGGPVCPDGAGEVHHQDVGHLTSSHELRPHEGGQVALEHAPSVSASCALDVDELRGVHDVDVRLRCGDPHAPGGEGAVAAVLRDGRPASRALSTAMSGSPVTPCIQAWTGSATSPVSRTRTCTPSPWLLASHPATGRPAPGHRGSAGPGLLRLDRRARVDADEEQAVQAHPVFSQLSLEERELLTERRVRPRRIPVTSSRAARPPSIDVVAVEATPRPREFSSAVSASCVRGRRVCPCGRGTRLRNPGCPSRRGTRRRCR